MPATFSWKRGLVHTLVSTVLLLGYFAWSARVTGVRSWWLIAVAVEVPIALTISFLSQTGRRHAAKLIGLGVALALFGVGQLFRIKTAAVTFTDAERAPLLTVDDGGQRRLRHPTLGFSVLHPGPGFVDSGAQAFRANAHFYSFGDPSAGAALFIGLFKGVGDSPASLRSLLDAMSKELGGLAGGSGQSVRLERLEVSAADPPQGELQATIGENRRYQLKAHGWKPPGRSSFAILIAVMSATPGVHGEVLASFRP